LNNKTLAVALLFALMLSLVSAIPFAKALPVDGELEPPPNPDTYIECVGLGALGETVDPSWSYDTSSGTIIFNVYETLIFFDGPKYNEFVPQLADWYPGSDAEGGVPIPSPKDPAAPNGHYVINGHIYDVGDTEETWYFKIRQNVPWQDPAYGFMTVGDVEYSFERTMVMDRVGGPVWLLLDPLLAIMSTRHYDLLNDTEAELVGRMIDDAVQSGYRTDLGGGAGDYVWLNLKSPYPPFAQILSQSWAAIMCKQWMIDDDPGTIGANFPGFDATGYINWRDYNDPEYPGPLMDPDPPGAVMMGTGPYYLESWLPLGTETWTLAKFDDYWGGWSDHPHVNKYLWKTAGTSTRITLLKSNTTTQADVIGLPRSRGPDLYGIPGIRFADNLETQIGDGFFFNADPDPLSSYIPYLGGVAKHDLFSDRNLRLAINYVNNMTKLIADIYLGQGSPRGNPIIGGIKYFNGSKPIYDKDLVLAKHYFKLAWGGSDPTPNDKTNGDEIPGDVWNLGFTMYATFNTGPGGFREAYANMLEVVIQSEITGWGVIPDVIPTPIDWDPYLAEMDANRLASFCLGWLSDFSDPHNWVQPYMHSRGDFSGFQNIDYGSDPTTLNWYKNTYGPLPYTNYAGKTVAALNNSYVDSLIEEGIHIADTNLRQKLYEELMDIFFAEAYTHMNVQTTARHWERTWIHGWYYNILYPGTYVYSLWKGQGPVVMDSDAGVLPAPIVNPITTMWHELYPRYCRPYHLTSWVDNGDGYLSESDQIDMTDARGKVRWYHVDRVTITIFLTRKDFPQKPTIMDVDYHYDPEFILLNPLTTLWHEIRPNYCRGPFHLTSWVDNGDGRLSVSDQIDMTDAKGRVSWYHVDRISTDIYLTPKHLVRDVASSMKWSLPNYLVFDAHNWGDMPYELVYEYITVEFASSEFANAAAAVAAVQFLHDAWGRIVVTGGATWKITVHAYASIPYCIDTDIVRIKTSLKGNLLSADETIKFFGPLPYPAKWDSGLGKWVHVLSPGKGWIWTYNMQEITDDDTADNSLMFHRKYGDLGDDTPAFEVFDKDADGFDLALFIQCFNDLAPPQYMYLGDLGNDTPIWFAFDGDTDGFDLALFIQCFNDLGP